MASNIPCYFEAILRNISSHLLLAVTVRLRIFPICQLDSRFLSCVALHVPKQRGRVADNRKIQNMSWKVFNHSVIYIVQSAFGYENRMQYASIIVTSNSRFQWCRLFDVHRIPKFTEKIVVRKKVWRRGYCNQGNCGKTFWVSELRFLYEKCCIFIFS